jgi:uncharacterized protein (DUF433 family)
LTLQEQTFYSEGNASLPLDLEISGTSQQGRPGKVDVMSTVADTVPTQIRGPYGGIYTIRDAALYLRSTTPPPLIPLRRWSPNGRQFIAPSSHHLAAWLRAGLDGHADRHVSRRGSVINFTDLVRLRMIVLLRSRGIPHAAIHRAEETARQLTHSPEPFVTEELWTSSTGIFLRFRDSLVAASKGPQTMMKFMDEYFTPVYHGLTFGPDDIADSWRPTAGVLIDPKVQFGAPCIEGTRIPTEAVWSLYQAGDSVETLAEMYRVQQREIEAAIAWETTLAAA